MKLVMFKAFTTLITCASLAILWSAWQILSASTYRLESRPFAGPPHELKTAQPPDIFEQPKPLNAIMARPLFRPDRKPFTPPPVVPAVAPMPEPASPPPPEPPPPAPLAVPLVVPEFPAIALRGIRMTGEIDAALLESPDFPQGKWISVGTELLGWHITRIEKERVIFSAGDIKHTLQLYVDNPTNAVGNP